MVDLAIEPLHEEFGARVRGLDLRGALDADEIAALHGAIDEHSFLVFPDQHLDDRAQIALTRSLGEPEANHVALGQRGEVIYLGTIGNVADDGSVRGNTDRHTRFQTGNNMWHSDSSFREVPSYVSIMSVHEVPDEGGETLFVSARSAFERLPSAERERLLPLQAIHDYVFSRSKVGPDAVTPSHAESLPPVKQRLVRTNPGNGRRNVYIGSHAREIVGWNEADSRTLLDGLLAETTGETHVVSHDWQPGELVIWDNRCLLHRGVGYDADRYRRRMRQSRVKGRCNTLEE